MKKWLAVALTGVLLCGILAGCSGKKTASDMEPVDGVPEESYEIQWYLMADTQSDVRSVEEVLEG